jgi:hypothetical protein
MAIDVSVRTIDGKKEEHLNDPKGLLSRIWPIGKASFLLLQYINPYGVVVFGTTQAEQIQKELQLLIDRETNEETRNLLKQALNFATKVREHPHWFLWFSGD